LTPQDSVGSPEAETTIEKPEKRNRHTYAETMLQSRRWEVWEGVGLVIG
jgi:hypothetical protein